MSLSCSRVSKIWVDPGIGTVYRVVDIAKVLITEMNKGPMMFLSNILEIYQMLLISFQDLGIQRAPRWLRYNLGQLSSILPIADEFQASQ